MDEIKKGTYRVFSLTSHEIGVALTQYVASRKQDPVLKCADDINVELLNQTGARLRLSFEEDAV